MLDEFGNTSGLITLVDIGTTTITAIKEGDTNYTSFTTSSSGNLTIDPTGTSTTLSGDLIRNEDGQISYSRDFGNTFSFISSTNTGKIFPALNQESFFVVSDNNDNFGSLTYLPNYNSSIIELPVGIITAFVGCPLFIYLLWQKK